VQKGGGIFGKKGIILTASTEDKISWGITDERGEKRETGYLPNLYVG